MPGLSPIPFIVAEGDGLKVNADACKAVEGLKGTIGVICIAGLYRTGKSFIMNQLVGRTSGFDVGSTIKPCTQGIWIICSPVNQLPLDIRPSNIDSVILMDTEGLGSYNKSLQYDTKIFALAVLLSSYFVYNSLGAIDDNAMEQISLILELSKSLVENNNNEDAKQNFFFPKFMWLLRDFSLDLTIDGKKLTPKEYMERCLQSQQSADMDAEEAKNKNNIRECIKKFFVNRTCYALRRPVTDETKLQKINTLQSEDFRKEYLEEAKLLIKLIYDNVSPKSLYGRSLNAAMFVDMAKSYVDAINREGIPNIKNTWLNLKEIQGRKAMEIGLKYYIDKKAVLVDSKKMLSMEDIEKFHKTMKKEAISKFKANCLTDDSQELEQELRKKIRNVRDELVLTNSNTSSSMSTKILNDLVSQISLLICNGQIKDISDFYLQYRTLLSDYDNATDGPSKYTAFFKNHSEAIKVVVNLENKIIADIKKSVEGGYNAEKDQLKNEYNRLKDLYESVDAERKKEEKESSLLKQENKEMKLEIAIAQKRLQQYLAQEAGEQPYTPVETGIVEKENKKDDDDHEISEAAVPKVDRSLIKCLEQKIEELESQIAFLQANEGQYQQEIKGLEDEIAKIKRTEDPASKAGGLVKMKRKKNCTIM